MTPKYSFYEKVLVNSRDPKTVGVDGQLGAVLGRAETDDGQWYYTVYLYSMASSWCFFEWELSPTGEYSRREDFYDGSYIRVNVDKKGRGTRVAETDESWAGDVVEDDDET